MSDSNGIYEEVRRVRRSSSTVIYDSSNDITNKEDTIKPVRAAPQNLDKLFRKYSLNLDVPKKTTQSSTSDNYETLEKSQSCSKLTSFELEDNKNETKPHDVYAHLSSYFYYFPNVDAKEATSILNKINKNGTFILRKSKFGDPKVQPFTASIYFNLKTYHLKVRILQDVYFTIGEPKEEEIGFDSIHEIFQFFTENPIPIKDLNEEFKLVMNETDLLNHSSSKIKL